MFGSIFCFLVPSTDLRHAPSFSVPRRDYRYPSPMLILFLSLSFHHSLLVIPSLSLYPSSSHKYIAPPPTDLRAQFFFSLVVPSKYRISFLLSLSLSLSLLTVYTSFSGSTGTILFPSPRLSVVSDSRHARRFFFCGASTIFRLPLSLARSTYYGPSPTGRVQ